MNSLLRRNRLGDSKTCDCEEVAKGKYDEMIAKFIKLRTIK